jgi:succinyl-CoA synthetase beta subunit
MRLIEHDGKTILARHGVSVPRSRLIEPGEAFAFKDARCILKAQTLDGGRGKAGLVIKTSAEDGQASLDLLRQRMEAKGLEPIVMAEEMLPPKHEFYLSVLIDGARQCPSLLIGLNGGMEVEDGAPPLQVPVDPRRGVFPHDLIGLLRDQCFPGEAVAPIARLAARLYAIFIEEDAELIEINPLGLTEDSKLIVLDCKMEVDDSAIFRHPERRKLRSARLLNPGQTELEKRAADQHLSFVEMPGNVAVLTAGAGLGMAMVDALSDVGLAAANFIDAQAGKSLESKIDVVFERARAPEVEAIAIFFLQTANPLKRTMGRLLEMLDQAPPPKPLAIAVVAAAGGERGMTRAQAVAELTKRGYETSETFEELASSVKRIVEQNRRASA